MYDTITQIIAAILLYSILDWIDFFVKLFVISSITTWLAFFIGFTIRNKWVPNIDEKYKYNQLSFMGKWLVKIFDLADILVNIQLTFIFLQLPISWSDMVTHRMKRYKNLADDHLDEDQLLSRGGIPTVFRVELSILDKFRYDMGVGICNELERVDIGHCKDDN